MKLSILKPFYIPSLGLAAMAVILFVSAVFAQPEIQYPVAELGNCKNETECRSFCDKPANLAACLDFAEENNLMTDEEIKTAKKFATVGNIGPGGCTGKDSCEAYCDDISNIDECVSFAEQNNLLPPKELEEAKKVRAAIKRGVKPPPCGNKKTCDTYCEDPNHMEECIAFAQEAGFLSDRELAESQKVLQAVKRGVKPPPCRGREACDEYCGQPDNMEACMNFALEAGLMGEQEREDAQKMLSAMKKGIKPPNCRGKTECDTYCQEDVHFDECMNFAEAAGFMDAKEAEMARKTRGKSPGDCKGKEECESFCNNPSNQEICFKFAEEHGLIPEEQINQMKEGMVRMREGLDNAPPEIKDCLKSTLGKNIIDKIQSGELTPGPQIGDQMRSCFEKFPPKEMGPPGMMPQGENGRPPGVPPEGFPPPEQGEFRGPGGCSTPEECQSYCLQNPEQCRDLSRPMEEHGEGFPPPAGYEGQPRPEGQFPPPPEFSPPLQFSPPPGFEGQPPLPEGQFLPPEGQMPPLEQAPQIQQYEQAPPPLSPPPPPETEQPQSLRNSKYLGAIIRFLLGNY